MRYSSPLIFAVFLFGSTTGANAASGLDEAGAAMIAAQHGEYDEAIRRFGAAIAAGDLSPMNLVYAHHNLGNALQDKGEFDKAIEEYNTVIRLKPDFAAGFYARGRARFGKADYPAAAADFLQSIKMEPQDAYGVIWLHLVRGKMAVRDVDELTRNAAKLMLSAWPGPVINLFLGKAAPAEMRAASAPGDSSGQQERLCEAVFYTAEYELLRANKDAAKPLFQEALKLCAVTTDEYDGAVVELKRLP